MKRQILTVIAATTLSFNALSSAVWKVEKDDDHIFVGGTIHLLSESEYPFPEAYNKAFEVSDELIFETDIAKLSDPAFQMSMLQSMSYTNGGTIADDVSEETLELLKKHLEERGLPYAQLASFKASLMGLTITAIELQRAGIVAEGVDKHFNDKAQELGKSISWLESIDSQIAAMNAMGEGQEDAFLRYSMDSAEETSAIIGSMLTQWRNGDIKAMDEEFIVPLQSDFPDVYDSLLTVRNTAWLPQIEEMFNDSDTEFVLVGMLHLAGEDSVFEMLSDRGYKVTKL